VRELEAARRALAVADEVLRRELLAGVDGALNYSLSVIRRTAAPSSRPVYVLLPHWDPDECVRILNTHHAAQQRRVAIPVMDEKWGEDVMGAASKGGFTFRNHLGDGPKDGYMVSQLKNSEFKRPISELTADHVRDFVTKNAEALDREHNYLGGWLEAGQFYLDVSTHIPILNRATADAVRGRQIGIYDLKNERTINTDEAGWLTGSPAVLGSRSHDRRQAAVPPAAQGRPRPGGRDPAGGRWPAPDRRRAGRQARLTDPSARC
jgi:hypothetical protein